MKHLLMIKTTMRKMLVLLVAMIIDVFTLRLRPYMMD